MNAPASTPAAKAPRKILTAAQKTDLKDLRVFLGADQSERLREHIAATRKAKQAVREALAGGAATVPAIAAKSGLPAKQVLWVVAGLRKYGKVVEAAQDGDYPTYELTSKE